MKGDYTWPDYQGTGSLGAVLETGHHSCLLQALYDHPSSSHTRNPAITFPSPSTLTLPQSPRPKVGLLECLFYQLPHFTLLSPPRQDLGHVSPEHPGSSNPRCTLLHETFIGSPAYTDSCVCSWEQLLGEVFSLCSPLSNGPNLSLTDVL